MSAARSVFARWTLHARASAPRSKVSCNRSVMCEGGRIVGNAPSGKMWSTTINSAGLQRTLSQRMTIEFLLVVLGIKPEENMQKLHTTIQNYGATVQDLMTGNETRQILAAPTSDVLTYLRDQVMPAFTSLSSLLQANTGSPDGAVLYVPYLVCRPGSCVSDLSQAWSSWLARLRT